jgi:anti-sigma regulatory factor (Ser/Thr protein kinase)
MRFDTLRLAACVGNLARATEYVEACIHAAGVHAQASFAASLALEEAFVNVCSYAYSDSSGDVELACELNGVEFVLEVADRGRPFDVLALPEPDTPASVADRPVGGLGIHLIRSLADRVTYRRDDDRNILRMFFSTGEKR